MALVKIVSLFSPFKEILLSWELALPILLFTFIVVRSNVIRYRKWKNGEEVGNVDHPAVTLFVKICLQLFYIYIVTGITLYVFGLNKGLPNTVNMLPVVWFVLIIVWDNIKRYKQTRAEA
ncbi:hypothetical protein ABS768_13265 [Flavobacterium sp. ST-75]|uniref:Uncharacterized protein n=1 Tax=Flavobacterium rhizophilum TaxID=3163296 RepID=A0ABW8YEL6_9FLAO